jgi:hypothetical protein
MLQMLGLLMRLFQAQGILPMAVDHLLIWREQLMFGIFNGWC